MFFASTLSRTLSRAVVALVLPALFVGAAMAQVGIGFHGGLAGPAAKEGLAGFSETKFRRTETFGGSISYRTQRGVVVGVRAEQLRMRLKERDVDFGSLQMRPVLLFVGGQHKPAEGRGWSGHGQVGAGVAFTRFHKGVDVTNLERLFGGRFEVSTKTAPVFEMGGGVDYFFSRRLSLTTDFRVLLSNVGTRWEAVGVRRVPVQGFEKFFASNGQALMGIRVWLP
jgi:hypothetical protein